MHSTTSPKAATQTPVSEGIRDGLPLLTAADTRAALPKDPPCTLVGTCGSHGESSMTPQSDLEQTYRAHARFVWRVAGSFGAAADERDDAVHDVFLVVHRKWGEYDQTRPLTSWLFGITRMVVLNRRRTLRRHERKLRVIIGPSSIDQLEVREDTRRRVELVQEFLATLPAIQRVPFELIELESMSAVEVAEATGASVNTTYSRLRAARRKFQAFVTDRMISGRVQT